MIYNVLTRRDLVSSARRGYYGLFTVLRTFTGLEKL